MSSPADSRPAQLLSVIELGGYPNFTPLYERCGYAVQVVTSMRKALALLKQASFEVIVAEYNFQTDFRDRTSNLESLHAALQQRPQTRLIVFYEREHLQPFTRLRERMPVFAALPFPIIEADLEAALKQLASAN